MGTPSRTDLRLLFLAALTLLVVLGLGLGEAGAIEIGIGGCTAAKSFSWTGEGDGHSWTDAENWNPEEEAPPKEGDAATIQGSEAAEAEVEGGTGSICDLTVEGADSFLTSSNMTIEGDLTWEGGQGMEPASELEGSFAVDGSATLSHNLVLSGGTLTSSGSLDVEGGTDLTLADADTKVVADGPAEIGGGPGGILGFDTTIESNATSEGEGGARFDVNGSLQLGGDVESPQLDLNLGPHSAVDLDGNTWTLPGLSYSRLKGGAEIKSSSSGGVMAFDNLAQLLVDGGVTVAKDALISMRGNSTLTDGARGLGGEPAGTVGLLRGEGALEWQSGYFEGQLSLAPGFQSVLDTTSTHELVDEPGTLLRNEGAMDDQAGTLLVDGTPARLENWGTMGVHAGAELDCNSSDCGVAALDNTPAGKIEILAQQPAIPPPPPTTTVAMNVLSFDNAGDLEIGTGRTLLAKSDAVATLAEGGVIGGGGTLRLGDEGDAHVVGTTTLRGGTTIDIDGEEAEMHGGTVNAEGQLFGGVLNASHAGDGTLRWADGGIEGSLLTDNQLRTEVVAGGAESERRVDAESLDSHDPSRNPTSLTLASPTAIGAPVTIDSDQNGDAISIDGPTTIAAPGGIGRNASDDDGVIVDPSGALTAQGSVTVDAPLQQLGRVAVPSGATLTTPRGFTQTGVGVTALSGGTLSGGDPESVHAPIQLDGGSLHGPGTISADVVNPGATVSPGAEDGTPGTLAVSGNYTQQLGGTLAIHVDGSAASQRDTLAVGGEAALSGGLSALGGGGYQPVVPTTIAGVVTAPARNGTFSTSSSSGTPAATGWEPSYRPGAVDLSLVSTGAPTTRRGFRKGHVGVGSVGGLRLLPSGAIFFKLKNANAFPVQVLAVSLKCSVAHKCLTGLKGTGVGRVGGGVVIGTAKLHRTIPAFGSVNVSVPLNGKGRRLLRGGHPPKVQAAVKLSAPDGSRATVQVAGRPSGSSSSS